MRKDKIYSALITISAIDSKNGSPVSGLLHENIPLGAKRKLQKIQKELIGFFEEYKEHFIEAEKAGPDEVAALNSEEVTIMSEPVSLSMIENIQTDKNYDFDIIELIAK